VAEAIPTGPQALNQPAEQMLHEARVQAMASLPAAEQSALKQASQKAASSARAIPQQQSPDSGVINPTQPVQSETSLTSPDSRPGNEPDVNAVAPTPLAPLEPPPTATAPTVVQRDSYGKVLGEHLKTDASSLGNGLMRGFTAMGRFVGFGAAGIATLADKTVSAVTGKEHTGAGDAVFDFMKQYVEPAYENWKGPDTSGNPVAAVAGGLAEFAPQMLAGPAAAVTAPIQAGIGRTIDEVDKGHSVKTAATLGVISAITNALFMKIPMKDPNIAKRIAIAVLGGNAVNRLGDASQKMLGELLKDPDFKKAVKDIDPANVSQITVDSLLQTAFAVFAGKGHIPGPKPPPDAAPPPPVGEPPVTATPAKPVEPAPPAAGGFVSPASPEAVAPATAAPAPAQREVPKGALHAFDGADKLRQQRGPGDAAAWINPESGIHYISEVQPDGTHHVRVITPDGRGVLPTPVKPGDLEHFIIKNEDQFAPASPIADKPVVSPAEVTPVQKPLPAVPDVPSAEPVADLKAQFQDAADKGTKRTGVFLSTDNLQNLKTNQHPDAVVIKNIVKKAQSSGRLVKTDNGFLVMSSAEDALAAKNEIAKGADQQTVIGRVTGAGEGKAPDQTAVVQGHTPDGAVATESMVRPEEIPAKVAEVQAEGKSPVVTTPEAATARRAAVIAAEPRMGLAQVGKRELPVHIEEGAPEGMTRVRPMNEQGEPGELTHDIPSERVRSAPEPKPPAEKPDQAEPAPSAPEAPAVDAGSAAAKAAEEAPTSGANSQLETALKNHEAQEEVLPGKTFAGSLSERQDNTSSFAAALLHSAKAAEGTAPEAVVKRAVDAANAGINMGVKTSEATRKGRGTSHARISAINEEMHKAARLLMGKAKPGDEAATVAPKAAALKAKVAKDNVKAAEPEAPKPRTAAQRAREEVLAGGKEENVLTARQIKKRTAELEAQDAKAKAEAEKTKAEGMIDSGITDKVPVVETVTAAQLRKAKLEARVDADQAGMSGHEVHAAKAEASAKIYNDLQKRWDAEHGEPESKTETVGDRLKQKHAENEHQKLVDDYAHATDEEAPEHFGRVVQSTEKIAKRKMTTAEKAAIYTKLEDARDVQKLTQEQASDGDASIAYDISPAGRYEREWENFHKTLASNGFIEKVMQAQAAGKSISAHKMLDAMIKSATTPVMRDMMAHLRAYVPDVVVRPQEMVMDPYTGDTNKDWGGMYNPRIRFLQVRTAKDAQGFARNAFHELVHAATSHFVLNNPDHPLTKRMESLLEEFRDRYRARGPEYAQHLNDHIAYFTDPKNNPKPGQYNPTLYGMTNIREFMSESLSNPLFTEGIAKSEDWVRNKPSPVPLPGRTTLMGRIIDTVGKMLGMGQPETSLLARVLGTTEDIMRSQKMNEDRLGLSSTAQVYEASLSPEIRERIAQDAMLSSLHDPEKVALLSIGDEDPPLRMVDEQIKKTIGEDATRLIRKFVAGGRSGVIGALRAVVPSLTSYPQIMSRRMSDFGHLDDPKNPLRQLEEANDGQTSIQTEIQQRVKPVIEARLRLGVETSRKLGQLQIDATSWGIDPSKPKDQQTALAQSMPKFDERYAEFAARWKNTSAEAQKVFIDERDSLQWVSRKTHRAGVDTALMSYDMKNIGPAQRALLYNVRDPAQYDDLIGSGKLIDVGESNAPLTQALKSMAGLTKISGIYFPLARHGNLVVQVEPEGSKSFSSQAEANTFANRVQSLSPGSKAKVVNRGGQWVVDYKADYVSMHNKQSEAEADRARMIGLGFDVGHVTQKTFGKENAPLTVGLKDMVAEATRHIRSGTAEGEENEAAQALVETLRSTFLQMIAARSAYAGSKLARKATAGVKAEEMGQNYAQHMQSAAWHTSALASVFKQADALAAVRAAARDQHATVDQATMYRRGQAVEEIGRRMQQELRDYGKKPPGNALIAKLGFANYLLHPSQAIINMTQNFQVAIPLAAARYGTARSVAAFGRAMKVVIGPAFNGLGQGFMRGATGHDILLRVIDAVRNSPSHAKWAQGENSPLAQLLDKGVIDSTFSNELADMAKGSNPFWSRVFEYARLLPNMSETFNRVSTALAGLELTNGNIRATADLIRQAHFDYSPGAQPRAFKGIRNNIPVLGSSIVMFKTYAQGMAHLLYSNVRDSVMGAHNHEGNAFQKRAEAAKTVAGLVLATAIFSGVKGATPELVRLAAWAYNKTFGDKDEYFNLDNSMHRLLAEEFGKKAGDTLFSGVPTLAGVNISNNVGLNSLILNNPPDLLSSDQGAYKDFLFQAAGPLPSLLASNITGFYKKAEQGDLLGAVNSAIPVRAYQDAIRAFNLYSGGTATSGGNMMVEPGDKWGTAMQAIGFTPQTLAKARERVGDAVDYSKFVKGRRDDLLKQFANGPIDTKALNNFNRANPGRAITVSEIIKYKRFAQQSSAEAKGGLTRDPTVNKIMDH